MSDEVSKSSEQGRIASHPARRVNPLFVSPATGSEFNTLSLPLPAVACVQLADVLFEFDSSFVLPEAGTLLSEIGPLRAGRANKAGVLPTLGVWGHADPVGKDEYNKQLSGRRAKAVYAVLTHKTALWVELLHNPFGGDNWQQKGVVATMRKAIGPDAPNGESALIDAYFAILFPTPLSASDFLAQGTGTKGKGDFQGCSSFNPLRTLAESENADLPVAKRNEENRPNRRVVIYLFRPGSKIDPTLWPCPGAEESTDLCRKQFFVTPPPGDQRRKPAAERREHGNLIDTAGDTFGCSFYDEISHLSPCEQPVRPKQCCKFRGLVVNNIDPHGIGRLQVQVPALLGEQAVFAVPCVPFAGPGFGFWFIPPIGANVWVEFEGGDTDRPIWSGCFWGAGEAPAGIQAPSPAFIQTDASLISLNAASGFVASEASSGGSIAMAAGEVDIQDGRGATVTLVRSEVLVNGLDLEVT